MRATHRLAIGLVAVTAVLALAGTALLWFSPAAAAATETAVGVVLGGDALGWGLMAAAVSLLILVGLAEGIAIYGLIVAVLILNRLG